MLTLLAALIFGAAPLPEVGIECWHITPGSPAEKAGLRVGDVLYQFGGQPVRTPTDLEFVVQNYLPGGRVPLRVKGGTVLLDADALGEWPKNPRAIGATFQPQAGPEDKKNLAHAFEIAATPDKEGAITAFKACAETAAKNGHWYVFSRAMAFAEYTDRGAHPDWDKEREFRIERELLDAIKRSRVSEDPAIERELRLALIWACYSNVGNANYQPYGQPYIKNLGELNSSLLEAGWPYARAALVWNCEVTTQSYGNVGYNRTAVKWAITQLAKYPKAIREQANLHIRAAYHNISLSEYYDGDIRSGKEDAKEAIRLAQSIGNKNIEAQGWFHVAMAARRRGRIDEALGAFRKAEGLTRAPDVIWPDPPGSFSTSSWPPPTVMLKSSLAAEADMMAKRFAYDEADAKFDEAIRSWPTNINPRDNDGPTNFAIAAKACFLAETGRFDEAEQIVKALKPGFASHGYNCPAVESRGVLDYYEALHGAQPNINLSDFRRRADEISGDRTFQIQRMELYSLIAAKHGDSKGAQEELQASNALIRQYTPDSYDEAKWAMVNAQVASQIAGANEAVAAWKSALELMRVQATAAVGESGRQYAGAMAARAGAGLIASEAELGDDWGAMEAFERSRSIALALTLADRDDPAWRKFRTTLDAVDDAKLGLAEAQATIASCNILLKEPDITAPSKEEYRHELDDANREVTKDTDAISSLTPQLEAAYSMFKGSARLPSTEARNSVGKLPGDTGYIGFSVGDDRVVAIAARSGFTPKAVVLAVGMKALKGEIEQYRSLLTDHRSSIAKLNLLGKQLATQLFPPQIRSFMAPCKRWSLTPDGMLWEVPFAALRFPAGKTDDYLGMLHPLKYAQSLSLLVEPKPKSRNTAILAVGDPDFGSTAPSDAATERSGLWGGKTPPVRLPATAREVSQIAALYGSNPVVGAQATEAKVRELLPKARYIHFATHGFMNPMNPGASGLLLTPGPSDAGRSNDGALEAIEVSRDLRLDADLVVLSACETAKGRYLQGEGIIGLARSFQIAGAKSVCASQWRVADSSTAEMMMEFHRKIRAGVSFDSALSQAEAALRKKFPHPYYWAGFVLIGNASTS